MVPISLAEMLHRARARLHRLDPWQAADAHSAGAVLIDIRSENQIAHDGVIPGALRISRNVLEWRVAPDSDHRHPQAPGLEEPVIVVCDAGYASSLAAVGLQELGFARATDLDGGFQAWRAAGLPVSPAPDPLA